MEPLSLFRKRKERFYFIALSFFLFGLNLFFVYNDYKTFKTNEVFKTDAQILNIYEKESFTTLKLKSDSFSFFTSVNKGHSLKKLDTIQVYVLTEKISFYGFLKGFYTRSFNIRKLEPKEDALRKTLSNFINRQHDSKLAASLYKALFLAIPIDTALRDFFSNLSITHLIAISGFHLGLISVVLYFILNLAYSPFHKRYIPYRNKRFDIMVLISILLFAYLILTDLSPSLLRAFVMFIFALFLLRNNIKLLSFETLFIVVIAILALFPKLLFSLAFWFSVSGVFYIYLFLKYFNTMNRYLQIALFNYWIFFAMNPIVHYFFPNTSQEQLLSPVLTVLFTVFYPLSLLLHILGSADILDTLLLGAVDIKIDSFDIFTPLWLFIAFIAVSLASIFNRYCFYLLNLIMGVFNLSLYI